MLNLFELIPDVTLLKDFLLGLLGSVEYTQEIKWTNRRWKEFLILELETVASLWGLNVEMPKFGSKELQDDIKYARLIIKKFVVLLIYIVILR